MSTIKNYIPTKLLEKLDQNSQPIIEEIDFIISENSLMDADLSPITPLHFSGVFEDSARLNKSLEDLLNRLKER